MKYYRNWKVMLRLREKSAGEWHSSKMMCIWCKALSLCNKSYTYTLRALCVQNLSSLTLILLSFFRKELWKAFKFDIEMTREGVGVNLIGKKMIGNVKIEVCWWRWASCERELLEFHMRDCEIGEEVTKSCFEGYF